MMSNWEKQEKEHKKALIVFGILLLILGPIWAVASVDSIALIAFIPLPGWVPGVAGTLVGIYSLIEGIRTK